MTGKKNAEHVTTQNAPGGGYASRLQNGWQKLVNWFMGKGPDGASAVKKGPVFFIARFFALCVLIYLLSIVLPIAILAAIPIGLWFLIRFTWRRLANAQPDGVFVAKMYAIPSEERKKASAVLCAIIALVCYCAIGLSGQSSQSASAHAQEAQEALEKATIVENSSFLGSTGGSPYVIEYGATDSGKRTVAVANLFKSSDENVTLSSDASIDTMMLGNQSALITLSNDAGSKNVTVNFRVQDTQKPTIEIKEESVSLNEGDEYDPAGNLAVSDPVDGRLSRVDERPEATKDTSGAETYEKGWYLLTLTDPTGNEEAALDTSVTGAHRVSVTAYDKNGNCSGESYFTVLVKAVEKSAEAERESGEKEEEAAPTASEAQQTATPTAAAPEQHDYVLNTSTKKIHTPGCSQIKRMKEQNKSSVTSTLADLEAQGYAPCAKCNPR